VVDSNGNCQVVQATQTNNYAHPVTVYNFTVENNHTYYVGDEGILVHNKCDNLLDKDLSDNEISNLRSKAGKQAKADALKDLDNIRISRNDYIIVDEPDKLPTFTYYVRRVEKVTGKHKNEIFKIFNENLNRFTEEEKDIILSELLKD
jgi:hypothetical protein